MENYEHQQEVRVPEGTRQVQVRDLEIGSRVLSDPAAERQDFLEVVAVEDNGALVLVTYRSRDHPVEYRPAQTLFIRA
jgi:hypothetical protein